jgi:hypothetical protein
MCFFQDGAIATVVSGSVLHNTSVYTEEIAQFVLDCNRTISSILQRFDAHFLSYIKVKRLWLLLYAHTHQSIVGAVVHIVLTPVNQLLVRGQTSDLSVASATR